MLACKTVTEASACLARARVGLNQYRVWGSRDDSLGSFRSPKSTHTHRAGTRPDYPTRTRGLGGSGRPDPYPRGHDISLLSLILHTFTPDQDKQILAKTFACLPSGGLILISELLVNDDKTGPPPAALMSLTMLVEDEGRNYTAAEYEHWLTQTGFRNPRRIPLNVPGANGAIIAEKP